MASAAAAIDWLCNPEAEVSAHYVIARDGAVTQLVDEEMRAWHAGRGAWGDVTDVNSRSIGIELDNDGLQPFSEPLMLALERLLPAIMARWAVPPERVIGHSDLAPGRKVDPGARFDWRRLARRGLSVWPGGGRDFAKSRTGSLQGTGAALARAEALLKTIGYRTDAGAEIKLSAFRLRFRPWAWGPVDRLDLTLLEEVADRWPVTDADGV